MTYGPNTMPGNEALEEVDGTDFFDQAQIKAAINAASAELPALPGMEGSTDL